MDYPEDASTWSVDDQFLMGDALMVAPAFAGEPVRSVYLPAGDWYDSWSGKRHSGKQKIEVRPAPDERPSIRTTPIAGDCACRCMAKGQRNPHYMRTTVAGCPPWAQSRWYGTGSVAVRSEEHTS